MKRRELLEKMRISMKNYSIFILKVFLIQVQHKHIFKYLAILNVCMQKIYFETNWSKLSSELITKQNIKKFEEVE